MKKLITIILILAMLIPAAALADLPDISSLSQDELKELDDQIHLIMASYQIDDGLLVPQGRYIIGEDLPAGSYRADVKSDTGGAVTVYESKGSREKTADLLLGKMWGTLVFKLELEEGNYLVLEYNSLILSPYRGLADMSEERK